MTGIASANAISIEVPTVRATACRTFPGREFVTGVVVGIYRTALHDGIHVALLECRQKELAEDRFEGGDSCLLDVVLHYPQQVLVAGALD